MPTAKNMTVEKQILENRFDKAVLLYVAGGGVDDGITLPNEPFKQAVKASILKANLFSAVIEKGKSDYRLDIFLGDSKQTFFGMNMETIIEVVWNLSSVETEKTIWQEVVTSSHIATGSDAFSGATRFRISAEKAAQKNIKKGIELLSKAQIVK